MWPFARKRPSLAIRPLGAADAAACAALHAAGFAHPWSAADVADLLKSEAVFGEGAGAAPHGFILSRLAADEAEILTIAVDRRWRRHGLGRALLRRNMARAKSAGAKAMFLEVDAENAPALGLYRAFGFAAFGERKGYYRRPDGKSATAQIMRATL